MIENIKDIKEIKPKSLYSINNIIIFVNKLW